MDVEGSNYDIFWVISRYLPRGMEEYHKNMSLNNKEEILVQRASGTR